MNDSQRLEFVKTAVAMNVHQRGGTMEVSTTALITLLDRRLRQTYANGNIELTLTEPDGRERTVDQYPSRALYRLDMALKSLVLHAPESKLVITPADMRFGPYELSMSDCPQGFSVAVTILPKSELDLSPAHSAKPRLH